MNEIRYYLKSAKIDKAGKIPVYLIFQHSGTQFEFYTKEKCLPAQWDTDKMRFRRSMPGYQQANEFLELLVDKLRNAYRNARNTDTPVTNELLREALSVQAKTVPARNDLVTQFAAYLDARKAELKPSTMKSMRNTLARLTRYSSAIGGLRIDGYTNEVHGDLVAAMLNDMGPTSVGVVCKHLITFFAYCRDVLNIKLSPRQATIKKESAPSDRIYLTEADLDKLETVVLPPHLDRVRDAFLFQCYTGLRYADLWRLKSSHIEQRTGYRVICLVPEKSVSRHAVKIKRIEIPLLEQAERILTRYTDPDAYRLLPVLSNQKMNDRVKEIAQLAGICELVDTVEYVRGVPRLVSAEKWQLVSSHVARHTFATLSLIKGVPLEVVSKSLGHSNLSTTLIYAKVADEFKNRTILNAWSHPVKR
jgi:site-specific recombinase XerD